MGKNKIKALINETYFMFNTAGEFLQD